MPRVPSASSTTATARPVRTAPLDRQASLRALLGVVAKDKKPPEVELKSEGYGVHSIKGSKARALEVYVGSDEQNSLPAALRNVSRLYIDESNKKFYAASFGKELGPFALPKGVSWSSLLDTAAHKPKTTSEKAVAAIAAHVRGALFEAEVQGRTQVSTTRRGHEHLYIKDPSGVIPGGGLIVAKDKMWIEMIPGYSGDCIGPFTLPKGYTKDTLVAALSTPDEPKPAVTTTPDLPIRDRRYVGSDSGRWGGGGGGRPSGLSPLSVRFRGSPGGGGSPG